MKSAGERLGYELRPKQLEIATKFVKGSDVFVSHNWERKESLLLDFALGL